MSYLSLPFASQAPCAIPGAREIRNPNPETRNNEWAGGLHWQAAEGEQALPLGVNSMEHWLDLNA